MYHPQPVVTSPKVNGVSIYVEPLKASSHTVSTGHQEIGHVKIIGL